VAARDGLAGVVHRLLAAGAGTQYRDESGRSALDWAEINRYPDIAALLRTHP
jgi:ankyrin repeat protein